MEENCKICIIDEYNNIMYVNCISAKYILSIINNLEFIVNIVAYNEYQFKDKIEKCDYVLEEFIY